MRIGNLYFSSGFLLLLSWLLYRDHSGILWLGILSCVLHEIGHIVSLLSFDSSIKEINITLFGAKIKFENRLSYTEEILAAAAGPFANLIASVISSRLLLCPSLAGLNLALALFNLLPVGPLDGARIFYSLIAQLTDENRAYQLNRYATISFTVFFVVFGTAIALYRGNLTLLLMCIWLLLGAPQEIPANFDQKEWK